MKSEASEHAFQRVKNEIQSLAEEQTDAMETAIFIGFTTDETERCDARCARIVELVKQLRQLDLAS